MGCLSDTMTLPTQVTATLVGGPVGEDTMVSGEKTSGSMACKRKVTMTGNVSTSSMKHEGPDCLISLVCPINENEVLLGNREILQWNDGTTMLFC